MKKIKKKVRKVRAYDTAGTVDNSNAVEQEELGSLGQLLFDASAAGLIKNGNAMAGINTIAGALPDAVGLLAAPFQKSTATTGGEAAMQSVLNVAKGAAMGAQIAGPWGAVAGAAIGAIGSKGEKAKMTSFTDYDEGTLGTGLMGIGNGKLRRERRRIKTNAYGNRAAVQGTYYLQAEALKDLEGMNTNTFALGGSTNSLAYVDDGELLRTPDGQISKVPERGKPTDSNLVNIPDGTRILSDSLKVPGTNKTFAQIGEKMIKNKKSKNKDIFALNAAKLNLLNNELIYNLLFLLLEQVKAAKGIKPKSKLLIPAAKDGLFKFKNISTDLGDLVVGAIYNPNRTWGAGVLYGAAGSGKNNQWYHVPLTGLTSDTVVTAAPTTKAARSRSTKQSTTATTITPKHPELLKASNSEMAGIPAYTSVSTKLPTKLTYPGDPSGGNRSNNQPQEDGSNFDWAGLVGSLSALPGIISDLSAKPEHFDANYNPYATAISNTMRRRRYDVEPELEAIRRNRAVSNYNANQFNTNTGANLAYRLQSAVNADRATAQALTKASNINNQYAGEYANTMNDLGRQWVNATNLAVDQNARSRGAARNINRLGYTGMAKLGQQWAKDYNQRMRDREMLPLYDKFLSAGFTDSDLALLRSNWSKYRR